MALITVIGVLGGAAFGYLLGALVIIRPPATAAQPLRQLSTGDTQGETLGAGRGDEAGQIADTRRVLDENLTGNQNKPAREAEAPVAQEERSTVIADLIGC